MTSPGYGHHSDTEPRSMSKEQMIRTMDAFGTPREKPWHEKQRHPAAQVVDSQPTPAERSVINGIASLAVINDVSAEIDISSGEPCNLEAVATRRRIAERFGHRATTADGDFQSESYSIWAKNRDLTYDNGDFIAPLGNKDSYRVVFDSRGGLADTVLGRADVKVGAWVDDMYVTHEHPRFLRKPAKTRELVYGYGNVNNLGEAPFPIGMRFAPGIIPGEIPLYIPLLKSIKTSDGCHVVFPNGDEINDENWDKQEIYTQARMLVDSRQTMDAEQIMGSIDTIVEALDFDLAMKAKAEVIRSILFPTPTTGTPRDTIRNSMLKHIHPDAMRKGSNETEAPLKSIHGIERFNGSKREVLGLWLVHGQTISNKHTNIYSSRYSLYGLHDPQEYGIDYAKTTKKLKYVIDVDELNRVGVSRPKVGSEGTEFEPVSELEEEQIAKILEAMIANKSGLSETEVFEKIVSGKLDSGLKPSVDSDFVNITMPDGSVGPVHRSFISKKSLAELDDLEKKATEKRSPSQRVLDVRKSQGYFTAKSASPSTGPGLATVPEAKPAISANEVRRISQGRGKHTYLKGPRPIATEKARR